MGTGENFFVSVYAVFTRWLAYYVDNENVSTYMKPVRIYMLKMHRISCVVFSCVFWSTSSLFSICSWLEYCAAVAKVLVFTMGVCEKLLSEF